MEQPVSATPQAEPLFGGRYHIESPAAGQTTARDTQPWRRCWACGATSNEAGERFCNECGAELEQRTYAASLTPADAPVGAALIASVTDADASAMLPDVIDQIEENDQTLTVLGDTRRPPLEPPLAELDALKLGAGLARLLTALHTQGLVLGDIAAADLETLPNGMPHLRRADALRISSDAADRAADLRGVARLLEGLTSIPRTTRRLEEEDTAELTAPALPAILSDVRTGTITEPAKLAERLQSLIDEQTRPVPLRVDIGAASHTGMIRDINEDSMLTLHLHAENNSRGRLWTLLIVADGMGGHSAGEVASSLAIRGAAEAVMQGYLTPTVEADADIDLALMQETVREACRQANEYVMNEARARQNDMGSTITMALVAGDRAVIGNVGDSRTYIVQNGTLRRVSKDHSLVMRLVDLGQITEDEIYTHPHRSAVMKSLGAGPVEGDVFVERLKPGDALLLCSDGQWEMTRNGQIAQLVADHADPQAACDALIDAANANGGEDNITTIIARFGSYRPEPQG